MTATERLRALLDERGVEWGNIRRDGSESNYLTEWQYDGTSSRAIATEWAVGSGLSIEIHHYGLTPEQAVEATLGRGTCKDVCNSVSEFTCSACGFNCDLTSWISLFDGDEGRHRHYHHGTPNYCPNCGRKVDV